MGNSPSTKTSFIPRTRLQEKEHQKGVRTALRRVDELHSAFTELKHSSGDIKNQTYRMGFPYRTLWLRDGTPVLVDARRQFVGDYSEPATYNSIQARAFAAGFESVSKPVNALLDVLAPAVPGTTINFVGPPDIVQQ